jgi:hypothetical protein
MFCKQPWYSIYKVCCLTISLNISSMFLLPIRRGNIDDVLMESTTLVNRGDTGYA